MKKISFLLTIIMVLCMFSACQDRYALISKFIDTAKAVGYVVEDETYEDDEGLTHLLAFRPANGATLYHYDFVFTETAEMTQTAFQTLQAEIENHLDSTSSFLTASGDNYEYYKLTSNGMYTLVSRIDNTLIYTSAPETYKSEIDAFLNELGY